MEKKKEKIYRTLDAYQAGFLTLKKHLPELINQNGKILFTFPLTDALLLDLEDYNNGAKVEASKFAFAIKTLKTQIHSMRRSNEYEFYTQKSFNPI